MKINKLNSYIDSDGYLIKCFDWNIEIAIEIAKLEKIILNEEHFCIINFLRNFYFKFNIIPATRILVNFMLETYGEKKGNSKYLFYLFPQSPIKQATKIAGLPKHIQCI